MLAKIQTSDQRQSIDCPW